jgi:hypothetical protein
MMELEKLGRSYVKFPHVCKGGIYITSHNFVERQYKNYYCYLCVYEVWVLWYFWLVRVSHLI